MRPLIVHSPNDGLHMSGFRKRASDLLDFLPLGGKVAAIPPVVYLRVAHRLDSELIQASTLERSLVEGGSKIINSMTRVYVAQRKDIYYPVLAHGGVSVPYHIPNPTDIEVFAAIERGDLKYPFVHRAPDMAGGKYTLLVQNKKDFLAAMQVMRGRRAITARFVDSRKEKGGCFYRFRAFVVFGKVDMWSLHATKQWNSQAYDMRSSLNELIEINKSGEEPRHLDPLVIEAGKILQLDVFAVDVVCDGESGKGYIVDVNPTYVGMPPPPILSKTQREWYEGHFRRVAERLVEISK